MGKGLMGNRDFIRSEFLSQLKRLDFIAKAIVEGFLIGLHRSPFHGFSVEFREHRPYTPGDEIKWIDWRVYGRTERFFVKKFEEDTNLKAYIILDASRSMGFPEKGISKLHYAKLLAASLAYLLHLQRDAVGLIIFDERIRVSIPPRTSRANLNIILRELQSQEAAGKTAPGKVLGEIAAKLRRRGLVIFISDLMVEGEELIKHLRQFKFRKNEVIVFQIMAEEELKLPYPPSKFVDMETGKSVSFDPLALKRKYRENIERFRGEMKRKLVESGIEYEFLSTEMGFERAFLAFLKKRERMF